MNFTLSDRLIQLLRSLSIQASWNFPRMQGLGFFYSLLPWLRKASGEGFREACYRHLGYFNTNPYMSPYVLGVVSRLEAENRGMDSVKARNSLMGPLGAIGDGYYWATLLPVTVLTSVALSFFSPALAPLFFLLVYNGIHLKNRWKYLELGYLYAYSPLEGATHLSGGIFQQTMERLIAPLTGLVLGLAAFGTQTPGTALVLFGCAFLLYRRKFKTPAIFALVLLLGILLGLLGTNMRIPWSV